MGGGNIAGQKQTKEEKRKEKCPAKEINRRNKIKKWNAAAARHLRSASAKSLRSIFLLIFRWIRLAFCFSIIFIVGRL